ncbi:hypothetical protein EMIT0324P_170077 [Pseudomonas chlororaphis]
MLTQINATQNDKTVILIIIHTITEAFRLIRLGIRCASPSYYNWSRPLFLGQVKIADQ